CQLLYRVLTAPPTRRSSDLRGVRSAAADSRPAVDAAVAISRSAVLLTPAASTAAPPIPPTRICAPCACVWTVATAEASWRAPLGSTLVLIEISRSRSATELPSPVLWPRPRRPGAPLL